jgi:hypothetical protein
LSANFLKKDARVQANDAQVQAINAVHPGVECIVLLSRGELPTAIN